VRAEALAEKVERKIPIATSLGPVYDTVYPAANNDEQMLWLIKKALRSEPTQAAILSLIAKSNEARLALPQPPQTDEGEPDVVRKESQSSDSESKD
jgi:hypothetical protein